jgi:hypothetical protein
VSRANGQVIRSFPTITGPQGGPYTVSYNFGIIAAGGQNGDFVTIYDFPGFVGSATATTGWTISTPNTSAPPLGITLPTVDDPNLPNLVATRTSSSNFPLVISAQSSSFQTAALSSVLSAYQYHGPVAPSYYPPSTGQGPAASLLSFDRVTPTGTGTYTWGYQFFLSPYVRLTKGDSVTIYDFHGFVPGSIQVPAGWAATWARTTPPPSSVQLLLGDDPTEFDLTFTWLEADVVNPGPNDLFLASFSAQSRFTASQYLVETYQSTSNTVPAVGSTGQIYINGPAVPVPEPSGFVLAGIGVASILWRRCRVARIRGVGAGHRESPARARVGSR